MDFNIDITIVASYMVFCLVIGLLRYGKIENIRDYTLGIKPFSTPVLLATTFATVVGAEQIIGNIGKVHQLGLTFVIPLFFYPISWIVLAKIFIPNIKTFRSRNFISLSDIMEHFYNKTGRWATNIFSILLAVGITATSVVALGHLLNYFLGIPESIGMIVALVTVTSYSVFGGITSVAFTDVFQFLIFFIALPVACFIGYQDSGGFENIWSSLPSTHREVHIDNVPFFISLIFFTLLPYSGIPYIQRALMAKDKKQFTKSFIGVSILLVPLLTIISIMGLITYYNVPDIESSQVLYHFIDHYLPAGIKGLMVAGLLAAIMSTQDSFLNTTSSLIAHDVCKQIYPSLTDKQELFIARISCIFISMLSISLIFVNKDIVEIIWLTSNFTVPLIKIPLIAGLIGVRIRNKSFIYMLLASLFAVISTRLLTGVFDTRSLVMGAITSTAILYILHKKYKKSPILSMPKINIKLLFDKLNNHFRSHTYSISSLYSVGIILCTNLGFYTFLTYLESPSVLSCSLIFTSVLLLLALLNDFWSYSLKKYLNSVWKFCLISGLIFIPAFIMFSNFHVMWLGNFILSATLFMIMTGPIIGSCFTIIATAVAYLINHLLPHIFWEDASVIETEFAAISSIIISIAIIAQLYHLHRRHLMAKATHNAMMRELKEITQERITESLNIKEEFLNKLNHELRIPLSIMLNTSDGIYTLWDKLSDQKKKQYLKDIIDSRERLKSYTFNILDLADIKQNRLKLDINSNIDLIKLIKEAIESALPLIVNQNKNLNIKLEVKTSQPIKITCDSERIKQVIYNLLSNAIKYSDTGIIKLSVTNIKTNVKISISDQGVGVDRSERDKIFEPFFEGSRTKSSAEGTGLGLAIAKEIILIHKGDIKLEKNKPKGSIFTITLPYQLNPSPKDPGNVISSEKKELIKVSD